MSTRTGSLQNNLSAIGLLAYHASKIPDSSDAAHVHETRVSARRVRVLLWVYKKNIEASEYAQCNAALKKIGSALGLARDCDVESIFLESLRVSCPGEYRESLNTTAQRLRLLRQRLQPGVARAAVLLIRSRAFQLVTGKIQKIVGAPAPACAYRKKLSRCLARVGVMSAYAGRPGAVCGLHRLRIALKRMRYLLEIFQPRRYPRKYFLEKVITLQHALGRIHEYDQWLRSANKVCSGKKFTRYFRRECRKKRAIAYQNFLSVWNEYTQINFWSAVRRYCAQY